MKNKRNLFSVLVVLGCFLFLGSVAAVDLSVDNYYPAPVEAGGYFNIWLKISNRGDVGIEKAVVKLKPSYPFSLDPDESEEIIIASIESGSFARVKMKIRVDAGAVEGDNDIIFQYADCIGCELKEKIIPLTVVEQQTSFDVVLQELSQEGVFIAIANIGKNPANAVTVRIPEQDHFKTDLVSASIVGNLQSGDYTLVNFQISPKSAMQGTFSGRTMPSSDEETEDGLKDLIVQIDYTDSLGIRRSVPKTIFLNPLLLQGQYTDLSLMGNGTKITNSTGFLNNTWFWVSIVLAVLIIGKEAYVRLKKKRN